MKIITKKKKSLVGAASCADPLEFLLQEAIQMFQLSMDYLQQLQGRKPGVQISVQARRNSTGRVRSKSCTSVCHSTFCILASPTWYTYKSIPISSHGQGWSSSFQQKHNYMWGHVFKIYCLASVVEKLTKTSLKPDKRR